MPLSRKAPRIFISGNSHEFIAHRKIATDAVLRRNWMPVVQDHFATEQGDLGRILKNMVESCDAVICLVGEEYGSEPHGIMAESKRRSYTQMEYEFAQELGKPIFIMLSSDHSRSGTGDHQDPLLKDLQSKFVQGIKLSNNLWHSFADENELRERILSISEASIFELEPKRKHSVSFLITFIFLLAIGTTMALFSNKGGGETIAALGSLDECGQGKKFRLSLGQQGQINLIGVSKGGYKMGSPAEELQVTKTNDTEEKVDVIVSEEFWLGETETTVAQWNGIMPANKQRAGNPDHPVSSVSWQDAMEFIGRLNDELPLPPQWIWTLPTEAQWEYACRAETTTAFSTGDSLTSDDANFNGKLPYGSGPVSEFPNTLKPVKRYHPNPWGFYDMHGNVSEWCRDAFTNILPGGLAPFTDAGNERVLRGGNWGSSGRNCRSAARGRNLAAFSDTSTGFRLAVVKSR